MSAGPGTADTRPVGAAGRGTTHVSARSVARIAARAAHEAQQEYGDALRTPKAAASEQDGSVRLQLEIDMPYPVDLAPAGRQLQHDVARRVSTLTGYDVTAVAVAIGRLTPIPDRVPADATAARAASTIPQPGTARTGRAWRTTLARVSMVALAAIAAWALLLYGLLQAGDTPSSSAWHSVPLVRGLVGHSVGGESIVAAAILCIMVGLCLLIAALLPGRRRPLTLRTPGDPSAIGITLARSSATAALRAAALRVPVVSNARVHVRRNRAIVHAAVRGGDARDARAALLSAVGQESYRLALAQTPRLKVSRRRDRS